MRGLIAICALTAGAASACPTADDLDGGIRVTAADGAVDVYQSMGDGQVAQIIDFGGGEVARNVLTQGVYVSRLAVEVDGVLDLQSVFETSYDRPPTAMAPPEPGLQDRFLTTIVSVDGTFKETQTHNWGPLAPLQIGDCTYDSIFGTVTYTGGDATILEEIQYVPALGLGLLVSYTYGSDAPEIFRLTSIEAVE